jgi:hypothetical protein
MRSALAVLLALSLALAAANATAAASPLFLLDTDEATYITLFFVDPANGQLTTVGSLNPALGVDLALAAASDNLLYSVTQSGEVLQIVPVPFAVTSLGNVGANTIVGLAYADGQLYADDESNNALYRIQLSPLSITTVGTVHLGDMSPFSIQGGDLARDASGTWYVWTNSTQALYLLDVTTATATPVASQMTGLGALSGLALNYLGAGDPLLGSSGPNHALVTLDKSSGATTLSVNFCCISGGSSCRNTMCPAVYPAQFGDLASPQPSLTTTTTTSTTTTMAPITTTTRAPTTTTSITTTSSTSTTASTRTTTSTSTVVTSSTIRSTTTCRGAFAVPNLLWPPDGRFVSVSVHGVTDPDGDPARNTITGIRQNEPLAPGEAGGDEDLAQYTDEQIGAAATCPAAAGIGTAIALVRAERSGQGDGRTYHIAFVADDGEGGRCTGEVTVCVPHDQGHGGACGDQGPLFDSTSCGPSPTATTTSSTSTTTARPTSTTSSTSSTTLPSDARCGDCAADCCDEMLPASLNLTRITRRPGRLRAPEVRLSGVYGPETPLAFDPRSQDMSLQIADARGTRLCATIPGSGWVATSKRRFVFRDRDGQFGTQLERVELTRTDRRGAALTMRGGPVPLQALSKGQTSVRVRVGHRCWQATHGD